MTVVLFISIVSTSAIAQEKNPASKVVGEAFGKPVTEREFMYYHKTAIIFTRTGQESRSEEETRQEAWQNLIYSREAKDLEISVSREELESELKRLLSEKDIEYGTKDYDLWAMSAFNENADSLERRIEDLLVINKFMGIKANPEVVVTEEEMKQKFMNQYNSFESEYILFENEEETLDFVKKVKKDPSLWKKTYTEKRVLGQKGASWINIMSLEALIDLWKIPTDDAYRILSHEPGDFIAANNYYGSCAVRLLRRKEADMEKYNEKKREYYQKMMTAVRKRNIVKEYFEDLLLRANYRDYVAEEMREVKIEKLKEIGSVVLKTNQGNIELELFPEVAPKACENFIELVEKKYFDGIIFHRVIKDFMIQGGDPKGNGTGGESIWGKPFVDEFKEGVVFDRPGLLAMANSGPHTNGSQFFITTKETPHLNNKHTIFGEVVSGYDIVDKIQNVEVDSKKKPVKEQKIVEAYIKKSE